MPLEHAALGQVHSSYCLSRASVALCVTSSAMVVLSFYASPEHYHFTIRRASVSWCLMNHITVHPCCLLLFSSWVLRSLLAPHTVTVTGSWCCLCVTAPSSTDVVVFVVDDQDASSVVAGVSKRILQTHDSNERNMKLSYLFNHFRISQRFIHPNVILAEYWIPGIQDRGWTSDTYFH